jgi:hypothetical protein
VVKEPEADLIRGLIKQAELAGEGECGALGQEVTDERSMAATFRQFPGHREGVG